MCKIIPLLSCRLLCKDDRYDQSSALTLWPTRRNLNHAIHNTFHTRKFAMTKCEFREPYVSRNHNRENIDRIQKMYKEGLLNTYRSRWGVTIWRVSSPGWLWSRRLGSLHRKRTMLVFKLPPTHMNFIYWNTSQIKKTRRPIILAWKSYLLKLGCPMVTTTHWVIEVLLGVHAIYTPLCQKILRFKTSPRHIWTQRTMVILSQFLFNTSRRETGDFKVVPDASSSVHRTMWG